ARIDPLRARRPHRERIRPPLAGNSFANLASVVPPPPTAGGHAPGRPSRSGYRHDLVAARRLRRSSPRLRQNDRAAATPVWRRDLRRTRPEKLLEPHSKGPAPSASPGAPPPPEPPQSNASSPLGGSKDGVSRRLRLSFG